MIHTLPDEYRDLLERPLIGILATVSPDGRPSLQPMRFTWDGAHIRMSQTIPRRKFVPLQANPNYSFIITDSDNPVRVLEITGWLVTVGGDPEGDFYRELGRRYGNADEPVPAGPHNFTDVPTNSYYNSAVAWLVESGITGGTSPGA